MKAIVGLLGILSFVGAWGGKECELDCSLNGECRDGICACDYGWTGDQCDILNIGTVRQYSGYFNKTQGSWGGRPVQTADGKWHLFAAQMLNECKLPSWMNNSAVIHAVSDSAGGPYTYVEQVLHPFSHNPKAYIAPDGTFVIFLIGGGLWSPPVANCTFSGERYFEEGGASPKSIDFEEGGASPKGIDFEEGGASPKGIDFEVGGASPKSINFEVGASPMKDGCGERPLNGGCGIAMAWSESIDGPWKVEPVIMENENASKVFDCAHTNPSVVFHKNGSLTMAFNAGFCHGDMETIGLATAPSWKGPYNVATLTPIFTDSNGQAHHCEDPTIWQSDRGWHAIVHNLEGDGIARYAHSLDARNWTLHDAPGPYNETVFFDDGTSKEYNLQRPELIFQDGRATHIINGALSPDETFTLIRPLLP